MGKTMAERLCGKYQIERASGCWLWTGTQFASGYGAVRSGGKGFRCIRADRASYEVHRACLGPHDVTEQTCGNRLCINPDHIVVNRSETEAARSLPGEEWRPSPGWEHYETSNLGRVRRALTAPNTPGTRRGKVIKPCSNEGYQIVGLRRDGRTEMTSVHRMVVLAFIGPPPSPDHVVAHWDGDPTNNRVENLRWATPSENNQDTLRHGRVPLGEANKASRLTREAVAEIRRAYRPRKVSQQALADKFGVTQTTVSSVLRGRIWKWLPDERSDAGGAS